jgi:hypothetical protein
MPSASRKRATLTWRPEWNTQVEKWTKYQIDKNIWRFDNIEGFDDLLQQARILFWELSLKYPAADGPSHFFALYKTSLLRRFTDKARARQKSIIDQNAVVDNEGLDSRLGYTINAGQINLLLEEMPDELKTVLGALTSGRVRLKLDRPTTSTRYRENHNMRLKRRLALSMANPVGDLRNYFNS